MSMYVFGVPQLVLPRCMGIVAIFFVCVIHKHAKSSYHLCVLTYYSTENYICWLPYLHHRMRQH